MSQRRPKLGMTVEARKAYFGLYNDAAAAQGWNPKDDGLRRDMTLHVARVCGFASDGSSTKLDPHQITALFTYLTAMAKPGSGQAQHNWRRCSEDYIAFSHLHQSEHFRKVAGYKTGGKLDRERFGVHFEEEITDHTLTAEEVRQRLITNARHARRKQGAAAPAVQSSTPEPEGDDPF